MNTNVKKFKLTDLHPHPAQPPERIQDTTELQGSMAKNGQLIPIIVASDGKTVLSGCRRCTAGRGLKWTHIDGWQSDIDAGSPEAMDLVIAGNEQEPLTALQLIAILEDYEQHGITFRNACRRCGIKSGKARTLAALAVAPAEVREAVWQFDRGHKDRGMSLTAFAQMQHLPADKQVELVKGKKRTTVVVREARKAIAQEGKETRLMGDAGAESMIDMAHSLAAHAITLADWLAQAAAADANDVCIAYNPALPALKKLLKGAE